MGGPSRWSRRTFLASTVAAARLGAQAPKKAFPSEATRYTDAATDLDVYRLTDPAHTDTLPAPYNRAITRNSASLLFSSDRTGAVQAFRMDLKSGESHQLTEASGLDAASLTLTPDNRAFCYFAGRKLFLAAFPAGRERQLYEIPEGWERSPGMSVGPDGTHATFVESREGKSRLRMVAFVQGPKGEPAQTVTETDFPMAHPLNRPLRASIFFRQGDEALWMVNSDGQQKRQLKTAPGKIAAANWANDGKTILYLSLPEDSTQLRSIREITPDTNSEKLVAKTSQYGSFGINRDGSVFVGASANKASPTVLILLRITRRELTLCEHRASDPAKVCPIFSPDSQRIYFQSDREGKSALYCLHVERLVEKTNADTA